MTEPGSPAFHPEQHCLYRRLKNELGTARELRRAVQQCGNRDLGKGGIDELCPWCVEAVRAVLLNSSPHQPEVVERWVLLPARTH